MIVRQHAPWHAFGPSALRTIKLRRLARRSLNPLPGALPTFVPLQSAFSLDFLGHVHPGHVVGLGSQRLACISSGSLFN